MFAPLRQRIESGIQILAAADFLALAIAIRREQDLRSLLQAPDRLPP